MKFCYWITALFILFASKQSYACSVCGCSLSNLQTGLLPYEVNHTLSTGFKFQKSSALLDNHHGANDGQIGTKVHFQLSQFSWDVEGTYYPHRNIALSAAIPYQLSVFSEEGESDISVNGVGDMMTGIQYHIINKLQQCDSLALRHRLTLGSFVKFPTGKTGEFTVYQPYYYPGTGSFDVQFDASYLLMFPKNTGLIWSAGYKVNTFNKADFKAGNTFNASTSVFHQFSVNKITIIPFGGFLLEQAAKSYLNPQRLNEDTGGYMFSTAFALNLTFKRVGIETRYHLPVFNHFNGEQVSPDYRLETSLRYLF